MKLTEKQMIKALKTKTTSLYNREERRQIMNFAFGEEFMESKDKGELKKYEEVGQTPKQVPLSDLFEGGKPKFTIK